LAPKLLVLLAPRDKRPGALDLRDQPDPLELILFVGCSHRCKLSAAPRQKEVHVIDVDLCCSPDRIRTGATALTARRLGV